MRKNRKTSVTPSLVVASTSPDLPRKLVLATYSCTACSHVFASNAGIQPFCVHCGSEEVDPILDEDTGENDMDMDIAMPNVPESEDDLSALQCPECDTNNILTDVAVASFGGIIHCTACGSELSYDVPEGEESDGDLNLADDLVDDAMDQEQSSDDDEGDEDDDGDDDGDSGDKEEVSLIDVVDADQATACKEHSFVVLSKNTVLAFVRDICVARLDNKDDAKHNEIFGTQPHVRAMYASTQSNGLVKTLADFGFKNTRIKVQASLLKKQETAKAAYDERLKVRSEMTASMDTLRQCLGIAAAGLNKSFFKGKAHAVKASFYETLLTAGVRSPERMIDAVFAKASDPYHRVLIETAMDLMEKPIDVRNSMADAIGDSNYVSVSADEEDDDSGDEPSTEDVEDRLENGLTPATETSSVIAEDGIQGARQSFGRGRLFAIR